MPIIPLVADLLSRRVRSDGAAPLLTHYDADAGTRTEMSGTTVANWVAKTSNLISDELLLEPGAGVELLVAARHPGHWMTLVWAMACWQTGMVVSLGRPDEAQLIVCGPGYAGVEAGGLGSGGAELAACSLHPLGLGFDEAVPAGVIDYAAEVRGQPDVWGGPRPTATAPAWRDRTRVLDQVELLAGGPTAPQRVLIRPGEPWGTIRDAVVAPLRDGGSSVVLAGEADEQRIQQVVVAERVDAVVRA